MSANLIPEIVLNLKPCQSQLNLEFLKLDGDPCSQQLAGEAVNESGWRNAVGVVGTWLQRKL